MSEEEILIAHPLFSSKEQFLTEYSVTFGSLGRGVSYEYYKMIDEKLIKIDETFEFAEEGDFISTLSHYGRFCGPGCITKYGGEKYNPSDEYGMFYNYDFTQKPIDAVDAAGKKHDEQYNTICPYTNFMTVEGLEYDKEFVATLRQYLVD